MSTPAAQDVTGSPFSVGDTVSIRFVVNSLSGQGAGSLVSLTTENPGGILGFITTTLSASPNQVRRAQGGLAQPTPTGTAAVVPVQFGGDRDLNSAPFNTGDIVALRATVNSITGTGAGAVVSVSLEQTGTLNQQSATFNVSPQQCRRAQGSISQPLPNA
jgi:hypothetical protein